MHESHLYRHIHYFRMSLGSKFLAGSRVLEEPSFDTWPRYM